MNKRFITFLVLFVTILCFAEQAFSEPLLKIVGPIKGPVAAVQKTESPTPGKLSKTVKLTNGQKKLLSGSGEFAIYGPREPISREQISSMRELRLRRSSSGSIVNQVLSDEDTIRGESAYVYKDYVNYLGSKRITFKEYRDRQLQRYGLGYAIYLPEGYEAELDRTWPLIVFLIGSGERGQTFPMLKRHGPLRTIVEQGGLPFIVVVPMLNLSSEFRSFPEAYLDGVFDEILADYRIDPSRIYLTGLSMGGEATYRYTLHRPELFAAIAPMAAFDAKYLPGAIGEGFAPFELPMERIKDIPVWPVHGADDHIVPLATAQSTVDALKEAGGNVRFTVRPGRRHDAWTEMYADTAFYEWLLQFQKP